MPDHEEEKCGSCGDLGCDGLKNCDDCGEDTDCNSALCDRCNTQQDIDNGER